MRVSICLPSVIMLLSGCMSLDVETGNKKITDESIVSRLTEGMEKPEVEGLLGKPAGIDFTDAGHEKWVYTYVEYKASGYSRGGGKQHTLTLLFGEDGKLKKIGRGEQDV